MAWHSVTSHHITYKHTYTAIIHTHMRYAYSCNPKSRVIVARNSVKIGHPWPCGDGPVPMVIIAMEAMAHLLRGIT